MDTRPYTVAAIAALLAGCAGNADVGTGYAGVSCSKTELSTTRSMFVCGGGPVKLETLKRSLIQRADSTLDPREIGRTFDIPASEISGVVAASSARETTETPQVIRINQRTFTVYKRDDATIFVEQ